MTDVSNRAHHTDLLDALPEQFLVGDGAMGTQLQAADLTPDDSNFEGGNEIFNDTRPYVTETKYVWLHSG